MGLFWRRKTADQFVTLGLNEPERKKAGDQPGSASEKPPAAQSPNSSEGAAIPDQVAAESASKGAGLNSLPNEVGANHSTNERTA